MSIGTVLLIVLLVILIGGNGPAFVGGPSLGQGLNGGLGLALLIVLFLVLLGHI